MNHPTHTPAKLVELGIAEVQHARRAKTYRGLAEIIPNPTIQAELLSLAADIEAAERRHCELKLKIVAEC